jgi:hypothetical protein
MPLAWSTRLWGFGKVSHLGLQKISAMAERQGSTESERIKTLLKIRVK